VLTSRRLGHDLEPSILIGWLATYVRIGGEISLDIDLITSQESRHKLDQLMTDLSPSNNHQGRKLRATFSELSSISVKEPTNTRSPIWIPGTQYSCPLMVKWWSNLRVSRFCLGGAAHMGGD